MANKVSVIKEYFGKVRPVTNAELIELRKADPKAFDEIAEEAARQLGVTLDIL